MSDSIPLFRSRPLTFAHRCLGVAALLGACFVVLHVVTVVTTCVIAGFGWGFNAWFLDIAGFLAGAFFAVQCGMSSNRENGQFGKGNFWIFIWALATVCTRIVDTLMLFGIVKWDDIYVTPTGAVLWANVVSEVMVGIPYAVIALLGSSLMLFRRRK